MLMSSCLTDLVVRIEEVIDRLVDTCVLRSPQAERQVNTTPYKQLCSQPMKESWGIMNRRICSLCVKHYTQCHSHSHSSHANTHIYLCVSHAALSLIFSFSFSLSALPDSPWKLEVIGVRRGSCRFQCRVEKRGKRADTGSNLWESYTASDFTSAYGLESRPRYLSAETKWKCHSL